MVIKTKSVKPIAPLMPIVLGFGSRILDRYGWSGYYSWSALFMLFRNNPVLTSKGEHTFPISLFLKFINQPGKTAVSNRPSIILNYRPGLPAGSVLQPVYIKTNQPGGSVVSPGLTSVVYPAAAPGSIRQGMDGQDRPSFTQSLSGQVEAPGVTQQAILPVPSENRLSGRAARPDWADHAADNKARPEGPGLRYPNIKETGKAAYFDLADITKVLIRWSQHNTSYYQSDAGFPGSRPVQASGRGLAGRSDRTGTGKLVTDRFYRPLPVIPLNFFYTSYTDLTHRIYGSADKSLSDIHTQMFIDWREGQPGPKQLWSPQVNREQSLIELIKRENPGAAADFMGRPALVSYQAGTKEVNQNIPGRSAGFGYPSNTDLYYLLRYNPQRFYNQENSIVNRGNPSPVSYISLNNNIKTQPSPALSADSGQRGPIYRPDIYAGWMEIMPGERPESREKRSYRAAGVPYEAASPIHKLSSAGIVKLAGWMPLLVPDALGFIPYEYLHVPIRRSGDNYRAASKDQRLAHRQQEAEPAWNHPAFSAGTTDLTGQNKLVTRFVNQSAAAIQYYGQLNQRSYTAGGANVAPFNRLPGLSQSEVPLSEGVYRSGRNGQEIQLLSLLRSLPQVNRDTYPRSIEYNMINRQLSAISVVQQMARLGLEIQSMNQTGSGPVARDHAKKAGSRNNIYKEYFYDEILLNHIQQYLGQVKPPSGTSTHPVTRVSSRRVGGERAAAAQFKGPAGSSPEAEGYHPGQQRMPGSVLYYLTKPLHGLESYNRSKPLKGLTNFYPTTALSEYITHHTADRSPDVNNYHPGQYSGLETNFYPRDIEPGTTSYAHYPDLFMRPAGKQYQAPVQQALRAAARMANWIVTKASAGEFSSSYRYSLSHNQDALLVERAAAVEGLAQRSKPALPVIGGETSRDKYGHYLNEIQRFLDDSARVRPGTGSRVYTRNLLPGIEPQKSTTAGRRTLESDAAGPAAYRHKEERNNPAAGSGSSYGGKVPGMVFQRSADRALSRIISDSTREAGKTTHSNIKPLLSQEAVHQVHYLPGRLTIARSAERLRLLRESSRNTFAEPLRYRGSFARGLTGSGAGAPPVVDYQIPPAQVEHYAPVSYPIAGTLQERMKADQREPGSSSAMVHKNTMAVKNTSMAKNAGFIKGESTQPIMHPDQTGAVIMPVMGNRAETKPMIIYQDRWPRTGTRDSQPVLQAMAVKMAARNTGFAKTAGFMTGESSQPAMHSDLTGAVIMPAMGNRVETKPMIIYQDRWPRTGVRESQPVLQAMAPGVELNYRQEAPVKDRTNDAANPTVTLEMVQAQIEASRSEGPPEMSGAEIRGIADRVYGEIQRRLKMDRQCRGF